MPALPGGPVFEGGRGVELEHFPIASQKKDTPSWLRWSECNSDAKLAPANAKGIPPKPFIGGLSIFMADAFKPRPNDDAEKRVWDSLTRAVTATRAPILRDYLTILDNKMENPPSSRKRPIPLLSSTRGWFSCEKDGVTM